MKFLNYAARIALFALVFFIGASLVTAAIPALTLTPINYETVQVTVHGDANSQVNLAYFGPYAAAVPTGVGTIGVTDGSGTFTGGISSQVYGIPTGASVFVTVNGQRSASLYWPTDSGQGTYVNGVYQYNGNYGYNNNYNSYNSSYPYQQNYNASYNSYNNYNTSYNNGYQNNYNTCNNSQYGYNYGTNYNSYNYNNGYQNSYNGSNCNSSYNNNSNYYNNGAYYAGSNGFWLSQSAVAVGQGQSVTINAYSPNGGSSFSLSSNTNSSVANASVTGSQVVITGVSNGSTTMTFCASQGGCATLTVTVGAALSPFQYNNGSYNSYNNNYNNGYQNNYNGYNTCSNSQYGYNYGVNNSYNYNNSYNPYYNSSYNNNSNCNSNYGYGAISFNRQSITLGVGQSATLTVFGGLGSNYVSSVSPFNSVSASLSGTNTLQITANTPGNSTVTICSQSGGSCGVVSVFVQPQGASSQFFPFGF